MACTSLVALPRACGASGVVAGTEKLYIISYNDLTPTGSSGNVYTTTTVSGSTLISDINVATGKNYVEIGLLKSTAGLNEEMTKNLQNGITYFTQTLTVVLADITTANQQFVESVIHQPVSVVLKTRTGNYYAAGLNGQLELSKLTGGTGIQEGDLIGYQLEFSGVSKDLIRMVDPTILAGLLIPN
jgi:hypothetical protein